MRIISVFTINQQSVRNPTLKQANSACLTGIHKINRAVSMTYKNNIEIARTGDFDNNAHGHSCTKPKWNLVYSLVWQVLQTNNLHFSKLQKHVCAWLKCYVLRVF
jgi:hypothetical protein